MSEIPPEVVDIGVDLSFQCHKEKKPSGCHGLAGYTSHVNREHKKAAEIYKSNCDENKYAESCCEYGSYFVTGFLGKINPEVANDYLSRGCEYGSSRSCYNLGVLRTKDIAGPLKNVSMAVSYFGLACDQNHKGGCRELGTIYLKGEGSVEQDIEKSIHYLDKACNLKDWHACRILSTVYRKGFCTPINEELSEKYKKKAQSYLYM